MDHEISNFHKLLYIFKRKKYPVSDIMSTGCCSHEMLLLVVVMMMVGKGML